MKKLKLFFALFAMLALGVGNAWGADVTETIKMIGFAGSTATSYVNQTKTGASDKGTAMVAYAFNPKTGQVRGNKTTVAGASVTSDDANKNWSLYNSEAMAGAIKSITITQTATGSNKFQNQMYVSLGTTTQGAVTVITNAQQHTSLDANTITFDIDPSKGYTYFKLLSTKKFGSGTLAGVEVKVTYETTSGGGDEPVATLTANPTTIDFGTVYQGADVESKTVAVNFANLTGVTYSGLTTPFTATGTISNDGDKITIAADASNIEEYSQTLTIAAADKSVDVIVKMNVVEKPAPTGTFTLHTGDLVEGDYVIVDGTNAMNNTVTSNRLQYNAVTISNNEIVDPLAATIWHIAPNGEYWTIYSAAAEKYAASTDAKNQATLAASVSNNTKWTITKSDNTFDFENLARSEGSDSGNKYLRKNSTYGFACYASGTGAKLSLYRKAGTKYNVNISATTNGTVTASPTSAEAGTTIALTVTPETGYVLDALTVTDASSNPVTVTDNKFTMPASDVTVTATFKLNEKPAATLTLSKNGVAETFPGSWKQDDVVTLPSITNDCVKEFVGWSANPTCNVAPEYKAGDKYTLAATAQTLYAVYATAGAGETLTITPSAVSGSADPYTFTIDAAGYSLTAKKNSGSTAPTYNDGKADARVYAQGTVTLTAPKALSQVVFNLSTQGLARLAPITASVGDIATQANGDATVTWTGDATEVTFTVGDKADFGSDGSSKGGQLCFSTITVTTVGSYSNYSTTCSAALANPIFSLAEGKYTEAKSVVINYTEGTVYYTLDGITPTASSTQYTAAIALNDCGEYTIKAIAISSDSQSDVVSATYTIKLPLTNSQAAPYTEAEAIAAYDGGCYDNQDVYVKGTVKAATFNSTYGNYTITLTSGFQFYRFLQAAETKFTEDIIVPGDVLIACGKLSKYNTTYQLAEGCYLVERIPYEGEKTDISNTEATAYTVDKAFELIGDVSSDLTKEVYVKGLVAVAPTSNPTADGQMTYSISDNGENTGDVLKVYLGLNLNGEKFTSKNDVQQGDYVVVKGLLLDYNGTYELNKGNQLVQHKKAATITIADITMEVGETKTIAATVVPAEAEVIYTIKENTANAISLSDNVITANAVGTATITATIATATDYMGKTVDFKVTVTPESTSDEVVILAELDGKWYAMKGAVPSGKSNQLDAIEVTYFNGTLYNVPEEVKSSITWTRSVVDGKATFVNNGKYLKGGTSTDLNLAGTVDNNCKWMWSEEKGYYTTNTSGTIRTFLYRVGYNFKNYGASQAGQEDVNGNYSELPVVTDPVYATGDIVYTREVTKDYYGTICLPYASASTSGATFFEVSWLKEGVALYLDELAAGTALEAGKPYIFRATSTEIKVTCKGAAVADPVAGANGLTGTFTDIAAGGVKDDYIIAQNQIWVANESNYVNAYRAYIKKNLLPTTEQAQLPGRRRVCMGENAATGFDNIVAPEGQAVKVIENGQLIIIRDGVKYNVQGQKL